jgi:hypothetical protein
MFAVGGDSTTAGSFSTVDATTGADPVQVSNGLLILNATDLQSEGFGASWGVSRSWANTTAFAHSMDHAGHGWDINQHPQLIEPMGASGPVEVLTDASAAIWFQGGTGALTPWANNQQTLSYNSTSDLYTLTDLKGDQTTFYGFSNSSYSTFAGGFEGYQPASGSLISVTSHVASGDPAAGAIQQEQRQQTIGSLTTTEFLDYNYSGGLLTNVTLQRQTGSGALTTIRKAAYSYYVSGDPFGNPGDLKTASEEDASGNILSETYYRYTTNGSDLLTLEFTGPDFARLQQNQGSTGALTAGNDTVAPFATLNLSYDPSGSLTTTIPQQPYGGSTYSIAPVSSETVAGVGGTDHGGLGTYSFTYEPNVNFANSSDVAMFSPASTSSDQYNLAVNITTEELPDGLVDTYYLNYAGQTILTAEASSTGTRYAYNTYDGNGRLASTASPLAIASATYDYASGILAVTENPNTGLITSYDYGLTTTAGASAGSVAGYLRDTKVQQGSAGTPDEISSVDYKAQTVGSATIYYVADNTVYRNVSVNGSGGENYQLFQCLLQRQLRCLFFNHHSARNQRGGERIGHG